MNYIDKMHRYGRIWAVITCSVIMAFPFVLAICFSAWPDLGEFFNSLYPIALTFWPVGIIEVITYTPMLGVGGTYLGFVTGNLSSLKVPCALDSMEKANVKADSDEGEVISTISIATSSIVTILIIFVGVLLLSSISGFLSSDIMAPAFDNVLPALFGGLGVVYLSRYFKIAVLPMALMYSFYVRICHNRLEFKATLASSFSQHFYTTVIEVTVTIERYGGDTLLGCASCSKLTYQSCNLTLVLTCCLCRYLLVQRRCRSQGYACEVINKLHVDLLVATEYSHARL